MPKRCLIVSGWMLVLLLAVACGPNEVTPTATLEPVVVPTLTASPQPTETPPAAAIPQTTPDRLDSLAPTAPASFQGGDTGQPSGVDEIPAPAFFNLAAAENGGRIVSASDELDCCPASHLLDGYKLDGGEWWTAEPPTFPQAVVVELAGGQVWTIDRVVLNPWTSEWRYAWVQDFEIYVSDTSPDLADMGWVGSFSLAHLGIDQEFTFEPVRARYVALVVTSHYGGEEGITLNEFEVYAAPEGAQAVEPARPSDLGNLVAADNGGRIVDYSSEDSSGEWGVEHLIDGQTDTETSWSSSANLDEVQYVVFGFPDDGVYRVNQVVLNPYSDGYEEDWVQDFELWGSDTTPDLDEMWQIGSFRLAQVGEDQAFTFEPVALRYMALVPTSNYSGTEYALNEFEVYELGALVVGASPRLQMAVRLPPGVEAGSGAERPPESPPQTTQAQADLTPRLLASSGASPLEEVAYEIRTSDLVPLIYHLYGTYFDSLVTTVLTNTSDVPVRLRVEASVPNYTDTAIETLTLEPGEAVELPQNPPLLPGALDQLYSMKDAYLHVRIDYLQEGEPRLIYEGTQPLTIYSRDDFPWNIPGYYNGTVFLATLVTPNDPALDELMRVAADYAPGGITRWGYSDEDDSDHRAWETMKSVYNAVKEHYDVTYVATGIPFVPREDEEAGFTLQRLKLPFEVLETHSGMCVELSALFASAFEKLLLRPILITVPGHVYVGVPISWDSSTYYFLETTMVGQSSFEEAVQYANESFMENALPYIEADRLDLYFWLDVWEARQEGILPVPWR
jgi:hypothetical protein